MLKIGANCKANSECPKNAIPCSTLTISSLIPLYHMEVRPNKTIKFIIQKAVRVIVGIYNKRW